MRSQPRSWVQRSGACCDSECHLPLQDGQQRQHAQTNEICLFLETPGTSKPLPDRIAGSIILFFKLYEPTQRKLSFIGHFQVGLVGLLVFTSSHNSGSAGATLSSASCYILMTGGHSEVSMVVAFVLALTCFI